MKRFITTLICFLLISIVAMPCAFAATVTKGLAGAQDMSNYDGVNPTFDRDTSLPGITITLNRVGYEVDALVVYGGGVAYTQATLTSALTAIGTTNKVTLMLRPGTWVLTGNLTIPENVTLKIPPGSSITIPTGVTLTINGPFSAGLYQVFSCTGTGKVTGLSFACPEWWYSGSGSYNAAINAAVEASPYVELAPGKTYDTTVAGILVDNADTTLNLNGANIQPATYTAANIDYTIKITGARSKVINGKIISPDFVGPAHLFASSIANARKAVVWITGDNATIDDVTFTNIPFVGILLDGAVLSPRITNNRFNGGYDDYAYVAGEGWNHYAVLADGAVNLVFDKNYVDYCVQGIGNSSFSGTGAASWHITNNTFDHIVNHPYYIDAGTGNIITGNTEKNCGGGIAISGSGHTYAKNDVYLDASLYGFNQSGLGFRDVSNCVIGPNMIRGYGDQVVLSVTNVSLTAISENQVIGNNIKTTNRGVVSGTTYGATSAIVVGHSSITVTNSRNIVDGNIVDVAILSANATDGIIGIFANVESGVTDLKLNNNSVNMAVTSNYGLRVDNAAIGEVSYNNVSFATTPTGAQNLSPIVLNPAHGIDVIGNVINVTPTTNVTLKGIQETGTSATSYSNRYLNNKVYTGTTTSNNVPVLLVAGSGAVVDGLWTNEAFAAGTATTFSLKEGKLFVLTATGGAQNFNPAGIFPTGYEIRIYNTSAGANTITFDSTGANVAIAQGKQGMFVYNGTAWKGAVLN